MNRREAASYALWMALSPVIAGKLFGAAAPPQGQVKEVKTPDDLDRVLRSCPLPAGINWYDVGGQIVFPVYAASGGISVTYICYLVTKDYQDAYYNVAIEFPTTKEHTEAYVKLRVRNALKQMEARTVNFHRFDPNGGDLGREVYDASSV